MRNCPRSEVFFEALAWALALVLLGALVSFLLTGCATHSPNLPVPDKASTAPNGAHSGVYAVKFRRDDGTTVWMLADAAANANPPPGEIIAQLWYPQDRKAYNSLIELYGKQFAPPLMPDDHLEADGAYWQADGTAIGAYIELLNLNRQKDAP